MRRSLVLTRAIEGDFWFSPAIWAVIIQLLGLRLVQAGVSSIVMVGDFYRLHVALFCFVPVLLFAFWFTATYHARSLASLGLSWRRGSKMLKLGLELGLGFMVVIVSLNMLFQTVVISWSGSFKLGSFMVLLLAYGLQSLTEEVLFRGFAMNGIAKRKGHVIGALLSSLAFSFIHYRNAEVSWLALFNLFLIGLVLSLLFYLSDSLLLVTGVHTMWNFSMGCFFGNKVSGGYSPVSVFRMQAHPEKIWLNGGGFGFEGGFICSFVMIGLTVLFYCVAQQKAKRERGNL